MYMEESSIMSVFGKTKHKTDYIYRFTGVQLCLYLCVLKPELKWVDKESLEIIK